MGAQECRELLEVAAVTEDEAVMDAYYELMAEPLHPVLSPGAPGSPTPGCYPEDYHACCRSCGVEEEGAAAAGPWGTAAAWEPWRSFV